MIQLSGQLTPLETGKAYLEGKAGQAPFIMLLEPQQSTPLDIKYVILNVAYLTRAQGKHHQKQVYQCAKLELDCHL